MAKGIRWNHGAWLLEAMVKGERYSKTVRFANSEAGLEKAIRAREHWVTELRLGGIVKVGAPFSHVAQMFLDQSDVKPSTHTSYTQILNQFWMPPFANKPLHEIRPSHIRQVLARHDVSQKTKKNALIPLRLVFKLGLEEEIIASNPVNAVRIAKHVKPVIQRFTPTEKQKILEQLRDDSWLFFKIAFDTGMRTGEILGLAWEDITRETILVERAMVKRELTSPKTHKIRTVFINEELAAILANHPRRFAGGPVFRDQNGNQRRETKKYLADWTAALKKCRMTYRRPYTCRHTRASEMLMAGVEPAFAAKQLGHDTQMFLTTYADWIEGVRDRDQIALLNQI